MSRYRVRIFGKDYDAMADLVRVFKIEVFRETTRHLEKEGGYSVDAYANVEQISALESKGYKIERLEDAEQKGKERQKEVGRGDHYKPLEPK